MQPYDVRRFGDVILDEKEQERWCRAVLLGGLPFMWRKAEVARNVIYDRLELRQGHKVLVIGECIEPCGFVDDMRARIGPKGEVRVIDITDEARDNYIAKKRGRNGQLATWQWTYTREFADGAFDCAACLQGVQHTDDWRETGAEMLRVMKPGRTSVLAEIAYSPETAMKIDLDTTSPTSSTNCWRASAGSSTSFPITARRVWSRPSPGWSMIPAASSGRASRFSGGESRSGGATAPS